MVLKPSEFHILFCFNKKKNDHSGIISFKKGEKLPENFGKKVKNKGNRKGNNDRTDLNFRKITLETV